ncbi:MAG TPA: heparan-alpha-glucosaminide N-acetyltransferase domain-containing protein [Ferruginibacter sp.]|nr:heparan-alpha-glucosaminide N-acetyltransferase domain-containing protein [Ferruginibacter sp.]HMP19725.1 heparan-alpha-glucosaminide N-acetyltransferase domain-containing protein [Ferruginibacter sp.]
MTGTPVNQQRIQSIDVLRGLVMVIMALDHVRDFFYKTPLEGAGATALDPTNLQTTYPALFFTRWITHFCAPLFVLLSGVSIYLMAQRKTKKQLSFFLITRGAWLMLVEIILISFAWTFKPQYNFIIFQVIWVLGVCMFLMGLLIFLPYRALLTLGLIIFFGHNLMDLPAVSANLKGLPFWDLAYYADFAYFPLSVNRGIIFVYPFIPWLGVMLLGYCLGKWYLPGTDSRWRQQKLLQAGVALIVLFIGLRFSNWYGDPVPWAAQPRGPVYSFLSFLNLNKYPPSLLYLCVTLGGGLLVLRLFEKIQFRFAAVLNVFGRVPMLYYILHLYLIHLLTLPVFYLQGFTNADITKGFFNFRPDKLGFGLAGVYAVWLLVLLLLYPVCKKYNQYKSTHKQWWLSYL